MTQHPHNLQKHLDAAQQLKDAIIHMVAGNADDYSPNDMQTIQDTFEGATTLDETVRAVVIWIGRDEGFVLGCKQEQANLALRKDRFEKRIESMRGFLLQAMTIAEWPKH